MTHVHQSKLSTFQWIFIFHETESKCPKSSEKEETELDVVDFDHEANVYETNDDADFKIETANNCHLTFNELYDISQDSLKDMVDKYVVNISLTDEEIKHIEYSTRAQQSSHLWLEYRKEKPTTSNFHIAAINKVDSRKKIKSLFHSSVKTSSMKPDIGNEKVALTECVTLLTSQSVTVNLAQPGFDL